MWSELGKQNMQAQKVYSPKFPGKIVQLKWAHYILQTLFFFKTQLMFCLACYYSYQELLMGMQSCWTSKYSSLTDVTRISVKE